MFPRFPGTVRWFPGIISMVPRDCEMVPRDCRMVPRDCEMVPRDCEMVPRDCQVVSKRLRVYVCRNIWLTFTDIKGLYINQIIAYVIFVVQRLHSLNCIMKKSLMIVRRFATLGELGRSRGIYDIHTSLISRKLRGSLGPV